MLRLTFDKHPINGVYYIEYWYSGSESDFSRHYININSLVELTSPEWVLDKIKQRIEDFCESCKTTYKGKIEFGNSIEFDDDSCFAELYDALQIFEQGYWPLTWIIEIMQQKDIDPDSFTTPSLVEGNIILDDPTAEQILYFADKFEQFGSVYIDATDEPTLMFETLSGKYAVKFLNFEELAKLMVNPKILKIVDPDVVQDILNSNVFTWKIKLISDIDIKYFDTIWDPKHNIKICSHPFKSQILDQIAQNTDWTTNCKRIYASPSELTKYLVKYSDAEEIIDLDHPDAPIVIYNGKLVSETLL